MDSTKVETLFYKNTRKRSINLDGNYFYIRKLLHNVKKLDILFLKKIFKEIFSLIHGRLEFLQKFGCKLSQSISKRFFDFRDILEVSTTLISYKFQIFAS